MTIGYHPRFIVPYRTFDDLMFNVMYIADQPAFAGPPDAEVGSAGWLPSWLFQKERHQPC